MVHYKIVSIDSRMFGFALGTTDRIKIWIIEKNDLGTLIDTSERNKNDNLGGSLNINN